MRTHAVADAADGLDEGAGRLHFGSGGELAAHVVHVHVENVGRGFGRHLPDLFEELGARADLAAAQHKRFEQGELLAGEFDDNAGPLNGAAQAIELDVLPTEDGIGVTLAAAKDGAAAGGELLEAERLGEEVVGPEIKAADTFFELAAAGEDNDGGLRAFAGEELENFAAIAPREPEVEHNQIGRPGAGALHRGVTVADPFHFMTFERETLLEKHPQGPIILNY